MSDSRACIFGVRGMRLTAGEKWFLEQSRPWGVILFARNIETREQVQALVHELKTVTGREDLPILVDQEGGRVARLTPPEWPAYPPAAQFGRIYKADRQKGLEALELSTRLMAHDLREVGITMNCMPVADVPASDEHGIIGNRAYADDPETVGVLAGHAAKIMLASGVLPVVKHIPGHGRAKVDSHLELPTVTITMNELNAVDFEPFRALKDYPVAMTAHVIYSAVDSSQPATWSAKVVNETIRGVIGFDGLLLTDDLSMKALSGGYAERTRRSLEAGCDIVLHCNGDLNEMVDVAAASPALSGRAAERAQNALSLIANPALEPFAPHAAWAKLEAILDSVS